MKEKAKLQPTAALVMHWAEDLYQQKPFDHYLDYLDLTSGDDLLKRCNTICDWYNEVILNRKILIHDMAILSLLSNKEPTQIIIMAAGMCPLSLKILNKYQNKVSHVFEIDQSYMGEKSRIYEEFCPERSNQVSCLSMDITSPDFINQLKYHEHFETEKPKIVIAEGISYYLSVNDLKNIIINFSSPSTKNFFIMDYLVPFNEVNPERRYIPKDIFGVIQDHCQMSEITTYTRTDIENIMRDAGGNLQENYTLNNMEFQRKGQNRYFITPADGWVNCALGTL
jgi:O-methyltransferase involved in polyketide biosynthesis